MGVRGRIANPTAALGCATDVVRPRTIVLLIGSAIIGRNVNRTHHIGHNDSVRVIVTLGLHLTGFEGVALVPSLSQIVSVLRDRTCSALVERRVAVKPFSLK
jgi:hypothetical protein